ncbi:hypothetical protein [Bacillus testis]|uniref:hypothetical protein n=1 Tax=Bacillus testis TaxID=1622072 RepID=UPI000A786B2A|nr:hypothetical protein [Bacillus testis]
MECEQSISLERLVCDLIKLIARCHAQAQLQEETIAQLHQRIETLERCSIELLHKYTLDINPQVPSIHHAPHSRLPF